MSYIFSTFLIPVLVGFSLLMAVPSWRYRVVRLNGYSLIIMCLLAGLVMYGLCENFLNLVYITMSDDCIRYEVCDGPPNRVYIFIKGIARILSLPFQNMFQNGEVTKLPHGMVMSIYIATFWLLISLRFSDNYIRSKLETFRKHGGSLERVLHQGISEGYAIVLTLRNRKVYVAYVNELPSLVEGFFKSSISIMQLANGYLKEDTLAIVLEREYFSQINRIISHSDLEADETRKVEFETESGVQIENITREKVKHWSDSISIAIPYDEIISASIWSGELHEFGFEE